jgi:hypothetical protein
MGSEVTEAATLGAAVGMVHRPAPDPRRSVPATQGSSTLGARGSGGGDQAATLRQLFAEQSARLLPVLVPDGAHAGRASWLAKLAQAFARQGERTLVVDAARLQIAAALGLRARFDLAHVLRGDCVLDAALLDAGTNLGVLPAARALEQAQSARLLRQVSVLCHDRFDLVLLLVPACACTDLPDTDVLVPVLPEPQDIASQCAVLRDADRVLAQRVDGPVTGQFRLLFLGMGQDAAATLAQRLVHKINMTGPMVFEFAASARVARDLLEVARAAAGWSTGRLLVRPAE